MGYLRSPPLALAIDFLCSYPNSSLTELTRQHINALLHNKPATIAQPAVCDRLNFIEQQQLIASGDRTFPALL